LKQEFDDIKVVNNSNQGKFALNTLSNEKGIIIGEFNENNTGWKIQFSLDHSSNIQLITSKEITITGICDDTVFLERLIRDIYSEDLKTRQWASLVLCDFIEFNGEELELDLLNKSIDKMVERLSIENDYEVEKKLSEGLFEFLCLEKLTQKDEQKLVIQLANLNKEVLFCYLNNEEYAQIPEVKAFINRVSKEFKSIK
jgi:hypothetical protein